MNIANSDLKKLQRAKRSPDFWLVSHPGALADILFALYYLPKNYKLLVVGTAHAPAIDDHPELISRIHFAPNGHLEGELLSLTHGIIAKPADQDELQVTLSGYTKSKQSHTVLAGHPEALASAVHHIARTVAKS